MKQISTFTVLMMVMFATSCEQMSQYTGASENELVHQPQLLEVIAYIDITESSPLTEGQQVHLKQLIGEVMAHSGNVLRLGYIYENSGAPDNLQTFRYAPPIPNTEGLNDMETELALMSSQKEKVGYDSTFMQHIWNQVQRYPADRQQTDILGTLPVLAQFTDRPGRPTRRVCYYSDMVQESEPRYLLQKGQLQLSSADQAREWAQKDAAHITQQHGLTKESLSGIDAIQWVIPGGDLNTQQGSTFLPGYWNELFEALGSKPLEAIY